MKKYDYILVGSGLYSGVFAWFAKQKGKKCLVLEKRDHIGGNVYCENTEGIHVHKYGAHIFHTSNKEVWQFVNSLAEFNRYTNSPVANYKGEMYNMPFNMNTFSKMWNISTPAEAKKIIEEQKKEITGEPKNLEEQAISLVGREIYEKLVKGYTEKQWGRDCTALPAFIIKRLPVRYTYDNNYFNDLYQGIPIGGYNVIIDRLFEGCDIETGVDYLEKKEYYDGLGEKSKIGSDDIIYRTVSYISANFNKSISLDGMAHDLGVSKFSLSRLFSKTFHSSFNQYVNEARLGYACQRIETTDDTLTEISMDSGFGSLRTFNRVFKEKYRLTPSEYRNKLQK